jgi:hypothetical protein
MEERVFRCSVKFRLFLTKKPVKNWWKVTDKKEAEEGVFKLAIHMS